LVSTFSTVSDWAEAAHPKHKKAVRLRIVFMVILFKVI
jgi:hypothetical protein